MLSKKILNLILLTLIISTVQIKPMQEIELEIDEISTKKNKNPEIVCEKVDKNEMPEYDKQLKEWSLPGEYDALIGLLLALKSGDLETIKAILTIYPFFIEKEHAFFSKGNSLRIELRRNCSNEASQSSYSPNPYKKIKYLIKLN